MSCQVRPTGCSVCRNEDAVFPFCAFGPYPDEMIMYALDRILYYFGFTKISHQLELATVSDSTSCAACSHTPSPPPMPTLCTVANSTSICSLLGKANTSKCSSNSSISRYTLAKPKPTLAKTSSVRSLSPPQHKVTVPASRLQSRTPRVDFAHPVVDDRITSGQASISTRLKKSLSTCSLACRRLKTKLSANAQDSNCVWTRLVHTENGTKIYEVYQNSQSDKKPWKIMDPTKPVIVFLVLPNGSVMPFEAMSKD